MKYQFFWKIVFFSFFQLPGLEISACFERPSCQLYLYRGRPCGRILCYRQCRCSRQYLGRQRISLCQNDLKVNFMSFVILCIWYLYSFLVQFWKLKTEKNWDEWDMVNILYEYLDYIILLCSFESKPYLLLLT